MSDKKSILIVDDTQSIRVSSRNILKSTYEVETAATAQEALASLRGRFFNLVLLDIKLPDMDGPELLPQLKAMHPDLAAIMLTGYASMETAVDSLNAGASGYLIKPCSPPDLLAVVARVLDAQHLVLENRRLLAEAQRELAERKNAEEALRASEQHFRALVEQSPDIIYRLSPDGRIEFVSPAVRWMGFEPQDLLGKRFEELAHPEDAEKIRDKCIERRTDRRAVRNLLVRLRRKGHSSEAEYVSVAISARGLWDVPDDQITQSGKVFRGTEGIIHDVMEYQHVKTQRAGKEAEHQGGELTAQLESANKGLARDITAQQQAKAARSEGEEREQPRVEE